MVPIPVLDSAPCTWTELRAWVPRKSCQVDQKGVDWKWNWI